MASSIKLFSTLCVLLILSSCGGDGGTESNHFEIVNNAGTIERIDPRIDALIPADANIQKLAEGFVFTEGPVWDSRNNQLYFSDVRANTIYTWSEEAGTEILSLIHI